MNELVKKLKNIKLSKKNKLLIIASAVILTLAFVGEIIATESEEPVTTDNTAQYAAQYIEKSEKELEALLEKINGAGEVRVMMTLENCYENVYAKGYSSKAEQNESSSEIETDEEYVVVKKGSNNEECLVIKVYEPTVRGVAVVAEGAGNTSVKTAIIETVCAVYNISSARVSVEEMKTTN